MVRRVLSEQTVLVLTALAQEELHGYGIIQAAAQLSEGAVQLRVGTLYGALDRLVVDGLVEPAREEVHQGRLRRYYRITDAGMDTLAAEAARRAALARVAHERILRRRGGAAPAGGLA